jgi:4-amino-4-deoxy-L-arabinose transferase-like glycosyltransferase
VSTTERITESLPGIAPPAAAAGKAARRWGSLAFAVALAMGAALRLWQLATRPDWQYDEGVYTRVATNLLQHGTLNEHITVNTPWQPFLYQPPFYFIGLARWFALTGPSIYHARVLGVLCSLATLVMLYRIVSRIHGPQVALFTMLPVIFDGWLLYIQRCSYIENPLLMLITAGILLYQRALDSPSWQRFGLAGAVLGFAAVFKHTGIYTIGAVALCWLILRRDHKQHLILLAAFSTVLAAYVAWMVRIFDVPGHDWYIHETMVQVRRVLGLQHSGGTVTSPTKFLHLLLAQYRVFTPSLLIAAAGFCIGLKRIWRCFLARGWHPAAGNAVLFAWMAAGVVVFGLSSLRFPQYFALILIPAYCFFWSEIWQWDRDLRLKWAAVGLAVVAGCVSFWLRVPTQNDNVFADVQAYAAARIPAHAVVVTEETVGDLIAQPWCRVEYTPPCRHSAQYAITWKTYLQSSFTQGGPPFAAMMRGARPIKSFRGFSGTATVWKLRPYGGSHETQVHQHRGNARRSRRDCRRVRASGVRSGGSCRHRARGTGPRNRRRVGRQLLRDHREGVR